MGLFRGMTSTVLRETVQSAVYYPTVRSALALLSAFLERRTKTLQYRQSCCTPKSPVKFILIKTVLRTKSFSFREPAELATQLSDISKA